MLSKRDARGEYHRVSTHDPHRVVFVRPRPTVSGSIYTIVFFGLWYSLLLPVFVALLLEGLGDNLLVAAFVLIFIGVPLIGISRFVRAIKSIFRKEVWEFDRLQRSISINKQKVAGFDDIVQMHLETNDSPEGVDHELVLIKRDGKRIVVDWSQNEGISIGNLAEQISEVLGLDITRIVK